MELNQSWLVEECVKQRWICSDEAFHSVASASLDINQEIDHSKKGAAHEAKLVSAKPPENLGLA